MFQERPKVAVIGSRGASNDGLSRARKASKLLVERGFTVVSGLAYGVDINAHHACMRSGGRTIAVIGTPLSRAYPAKHKRTQEEIYKNHLLVSQFPEGQKIYPSNWVARNRTMALIADATIIVEAGEGSGTLSQAAETQRLSKPLYIMRNLINNSNIEWPKRFLAKGATILDDIDQVLPNAGLSYA